MKRVSNLRLLIWNDDKPQLAHWKAVAEDEGFADTVIVDSIDPEVVVSTFLEEEPDLVVTDILHKEDPIGLTLVEAIRGVDNLVPIAAVTVKPDLVFKQYRLEKYAFCGIYPSTIFQKGLVGPTLRQALNMWHVQVPEFVLAKACLHSLRRAFLDDSESDVASTLREALRKLPYTGSINSWHGQICRDISSLLERKAYRFMKGAFDALAEMFQQSDPFFMAGSRSRRHLSHNVQVFFLGTIILLADTDLRDHALKALSKGAGMSKRAILEDALLVWACIGLTHDAAYLSQNMGAVFGKLLELAEKFAPLVGIDTKDPQFSKSALSSWPKEHHAMIASEFWRTYSLHAQPRESFLIRLIVAAILRHDSRYAKTASLKKAKSSDWATFLAVLCDELQDWQRLPDWISAGGDAPWRSVAVEKIRICRNATVDECLLQLEFILEDYASVVTEQVGTPGTGTVQERFKEILKVLEENIVCSKPWSITLSADFVSRAVRKVVERGRLQNK